MALRVVLDTNVLLVSISSRSPYHWVYEALIEERYELLVSTAILLEYEEVIGRMMGGRIASDVIGAMIEESNVMWSQPRFQWRLIGVDEKDDKFVDCAISGGADFIVTYDKHFNVLKDVEFPRVQVATPEEFKALLAE